MPRPVVIRLVRYVNVPRDTHRRKITRRAVFARDGWTCQYCGSRSNLTVDHVIPRSKGGGSTWENIVASCAPCNRRKGDRLPAQAGMHPRRTPSAPAAHLHPRRRTHASRQRGDSGCLSGAAAGGRRAALAGARGPSPPTRSSWTSRQARAMAHGRPAWLAGARTSRRRRRMC